jgi:type I restriction enzyme R subunit
MRRSVPCWKKSPAERTGQPRRALLALATGSGKTRIAVYLLKRIADGGQLRRALFICDRDELRSQGAAAFQNVFGSNAATVSSSNAQKNARVLIATYQTLDIDSDEADANFLTKNYPPNYFSHIIIDECHRSAWGRWSQVLLMNPGAVQIGLTATPRKLQITENTPAAAADQQLTADNLRYFGEPVYEYDMAQGIEDGYLAACEIVRRDIFLDAAALNERLRGVQRGDLGGKWITDAITGEQLPLEEAHEFYAAPSFEDRLQLPDRVQAMTRNLFSHLIATGGPEQKTIIFCTRDSHADMVVDALNNLYATWCRETGSARQEPYAFKCTAASGGSDYLADLRGASRSHFIATTVDLLSTGVDVPAVRNIVFFKYVRSPISFYQMVGRGTRLDPATNKLMFRVYDYTDATRLFGEDFISRFTPQSEPSPEPGPERPRERMIRVEGFDVQITDAGRLIVTMVDGRAMPVTVEEYKERLAAQVVQQAPTLDQFRRVWIDPRRRRSLIDHLPDAGRSADLIRQLEDMTAYDLYDVLAELAYGMNPRTRSERTNAFGYKHAAWLETLPTATAATIEALAGQFAREGTEGLENPQVFRLPDVVQAGGLEALKGLGKPADVLRETKERMFAA